MDVSVREMRPDDWKIFQALNVELFQSDAEHDDDLNLDWPYSETGITYYKKVCDGSYGIGYIAEIEEIAVGYVALCTRDFGYRKSLYVEIENIYVRPEYRSQGLGRQLLEKAQEWARTKNAKRLYVEAFSKNERALSFYRDFGFSDIGVQLQKDI